MLKRLTIKYADPVELQDVFGKHHDVVRAYDLFALEPSTEKALASACNNKSVHVIAFSLGARMPFRLRPQLVQKAREEGLVFEIAYNPALADPSSRRNFFSNASTLARASGGGRGVVISSGSRQAMDMRGPYDIANLASLFGMSDRLALESSTSTCAAAVKRAAKRSGRVDSIELIDEGVDAMRE